MCGGRLSYPPLASAPSSDFGVNRWHVEEGVFTLKCRRYKFDSGGGAINDVSRYCVRVAAKADTNWGQINTAAVVEAVAGDDVACDGRAAGKNLNAIASAVRYVIGRDGSLSVNVYSVVACIAHRVVRNNPSINGDTSR